MSTEKETVAVSVASALCSGTAYQMESGLVGSVINGLLKMSTVELRQILLLLELKSSKSRK